MSVVVCLSLLVGRVGDPIEPQPLPEGVQDTGINILLDQSHQMSFLWHWSVQHSLRQSGHRVTCSQASLHRVLTPGEPVLVRRQDDHSFPGPGEAPRHRPITPMPACEVDVVVTMQTGDAQPYLPEEWQALEDFVLGGGGLVCVTRMAGSHPLGALLEDIGVRASSEPGSIVWSVEGPDLSDLEVALTTATCDGQWSLLLGESLESALIAERPAGAGRIILVADDRLCYEVDDAGHTQPREDLLDWLAVRAMGDRPRRTDDRQAPWEHGGIGGAIWPENRIDLGGVTVLYADNQLPHIIEAAQDGFADVRQKLLELLPTPPNPGGDMYIVIAAGDGGGWAENVFHPKVAGTISTDLNGIKSVLAHELAHTMYGPEATDGTPGCHLPDWFSEAHAGWFQRRTMEELGLPHDLYDFRGLMTWDPLLDDVDLASIHEGEMGRAWRKAWFVWALLEARYGRQWYPNWLAHLHRKYEGDRDHVLDTNLYVRTLSESLGEDVAPLFQRLGTTVELHEGLPPIAPR